MNAPAPSSVFYRRLDHSYRKIERGLGCWLYDNAGQRYLDAVGGAFVVNLGHGEREVADAMARQASKLAYVNGTAFTNEPAEALAEEIVRLCPRGMDKVYFLSSGSEAVEAALKLARQYWCSLGEPRKTKIIARSPGYHGNTLLALCASARPHYRKIFEPWLTDVKMIPAPYSYRCPCREQTVHRPFADISAPAAPAALFQDRGARGAPGDIASADCPACSGSALAEMLESEDPNTVAAFLAEPVGGSSTGASVPRPDYYRRIRKICDERKVLFIADEVLTGAGRTGVWSALEPYGVVPDIMTLGKGIASGYAPLSAMVTSARIVEKIARAGNFLHAQTFSHHPVSCAAGLATIKILKRERLIERSSKMGQVLQEKLQVLRELPCVGDIRGRGLLAGIEFVQDKAGRTPFPRSLKITERLVDTAQDEGLVLWGNTGHADGQNGDLIMLAPPFIITESEIDEMVNRLQTSLKKTFNEMTLIKF